MTTVQAPARPVAPAGNLPPIRSLGPYDGPRDSAGMERHAVLLSTAHCSLHPLYRRSPGDCLTLLYRSQALNVPVGVAIDHVYINTATGRAALSAQLMAAMLRRAGITWTTPQKTDQVVEFAFTRGRKKIGTEKWEFSEAVALGLHKRMHWQAVPVDCLWARALARSCRRFFSDIVMGMVYTTEEVYDMTDADTSHDTAGQDVDPAVQEFLDQAASESATAHLIRADIMGRARKATKLKAALPDGRTLESALNDLWRTKTAQEAAARADAALAELDSVAPDPAAEQADAPAGTGELPCRCSAADVALVGDHQAGCRDRVAV